MPHIVVRSPQHSRGRSLGWLATSWIEHFVIHGPGDIQGRPLSYRRGEDAIPLSDELVKLQVDCYALDEKGERLYDSAFYSRPKGADKSGEASRIGMFEALGPCRFAGWAEGPKVFDWGTSRGEVFEWMDFRYEYGAGEPMGRPVVYPFLRILATEEGQTGNVYDSIYYNLREGPLREAFRRDEDIGLTRIYLPAGDHGERGEIRPSTASSSAKDGGKETWANFDETHLYILPELRRMYDTVRRNMTKRKEASPWSFESSTMYQPGQDSIAERSHKLAEQVQQGKTRFTPRYFFDHREAPADTNLEDETSLRKGLAEAFGDNWGWQDQDRKVREVMDPRNDVTDTRRYSLNQATGAFDAWITRQDFEACIKPGYTVEKGAIITLGLDPSESDDHTVLVGCEVETGHEWRIESWDPELQPDHLIPKGLVDKAIHDAFDDYDVVAFYSDVHPMEDYIDRWTVEFGETLCAKATQAQPIRWDMRAKQRDATAMIESYHTGIVSRVDLTFADDPVLKMYHLNARRRPNIHGISVGKGLQTEKIDGVPSAALARKARQDYLALPENKKRQKTKKVGVTWV